LSGRCAARGRLHSSLLFQQLAPKRAVACASMRIQDRQCEGERKKKSGQPGGEFYEHVGRLRAENIFGDRSAKRGTETFALRPLHQDHQHHEQRDQDPNCQKYIN